MLVTSTLELSTAPTLSPTWQLLQPPQPTSFASFLRLPTELRLIIWKEAVDGSHERQVIAVGSNRFKQMRIFGEYPANTVSISLSCSEAFSEVQKHCSSWYLGPPPYIRHWAFVFRPKKDVIMLLPTTMGSLHLNNDDAAVLAGAFPDLAKTIRKVALRIFSISAAAGLPETLHSLSSYESLEELTIVCYSGFFQTHSPPRTWRLPEDMKGVAEKVRMNWPAGRKLLVRYVRNMQEI